MLKCSGLIFALVFGSVFSCFGDETNSIDSWDDQGFAKLHRAAISGDVPKAKLLLEDGANVNVRQKTFRGVPLQYAAHRGHDELVQLLLEYEADLDLADSFGRTPIMWAAQHGKSSIVEILVEAGADVNAQTKTRWSPLRYAQQSGNADSIRILKAAGAVIPAKPVQKPYSPFYSSPDPFISIDHKSKKTLVWDDVQATNLDVNVSLNKSTQWIDGQIGLEIEIKNLSEHQVRSRFAPQWHGGEWPPTDLYASVTPLKHSKMSRFEPIYLIDKSGSKPIQRIKSNKSKRVSLRLDWPGTGSVRRVPMVDLKKGSEFAIAVMMVFEVDGQRHFTISKVTEVKITDAPKNDLEKEDRATVQEESAAQDQTTAVGPFGIEGLQQGERHERFQRELDFLEIDSEILPRGFAIGTRLPMVVIPGKSEVDDQLIKFTGAFLGEHDDVECVITVGYSNQDDPSKEIGIYAAKFPSKERAKKAARGGLVQSGELVIYLWADGIDGMVAGRLKKYFSTKKWGKN